MIGNVPFADLRLEHKGQRFALHDYFFAKSCDALREDGILALVTSHFTLDKQNASIREYLAATADFLGAIRLSSDAFKREGTAVVTDIVFLKKRKRGEPARHADPDWLKLAPLKIDGAEVPINAYFLNHPGMVLDTWGRKDTLYGSDGYSVAASGDLAEQLRWATTRLPEFPKFKATPRTKAVAVAPPALAEQHIDEGSFFVFEGRIHQQGDDRAAPVVYGGSELWAGGSLVGRRMGHLIELRDKARKVLKTQNEGRPEPERDAARKELNQVYDRFLSAHGPINKTTFSSTADGSVIRRMPNIVKFKEDPDAMLAMALEEYDEVTGKASKAAIMTRDVVGQTPEVTRVTSAEEGLLASLNRKGRVDLTYISELYGRPEEQIIRELGDLIYLDPESTEWHTADAYLSGNIRAKLAAESAGAEYSRNVTAIRAGQPEDVLPGDIDANFGGPWAPSADVETFAAGLFKVDRRDVRVGHLKTDAVWCLEAGYAAERSVAATSEFGTERANGTCSWSSP